jgi:hypothetical protein
MISLQTKIVIYATFAAWFVYDLLADHFGWGSISAGIRYLDKDTGGIVRWIWFGLGFHFFLKIPWGGWSK